MDNTELHYVTYDPDEIWAEMMAAYTNAGGDPLYPGDEKEILLRAVQASIVQVFAGVDNALRMQTLRYAVGDYLDLFGEKNGCNRIQESAAKVMVRINFQFRGGQQSVFPKGTVMTADSVNYYETTEDIILTGFRQYADIEVSCTRKGAQGNALRSGTQMFAVEDDRADYIITTTDASGGYDLEDDEHYRERIGRSFGSYVTTGTAAQYESIALNCSNSIIDAKAFEGGLQEGAGVSTVTVVLLLDSDLTLEERESIISDVTAAVTDENRKPLMDSVDLYEAHQIGYSIKINYIAGTSTISSVEDAVKKYTKWQKKIGRAFNPDYLVSLLYSAGCERVIIDYENSVYGNGGSIEYRETAINEVCVGTVYTEEIFE